MRRGRGETFAWRRSRLVVTEAAQAAIKRDGLLCHSPMLPVGRVDALDTRQGDLGLNENGQHRKRNRAAVAMEAAIELC